MTRLVLVMSFVFSITSIYAIDDKVTISYQDASCISSLSLGCYTSTSNELLQELKEGILHYFNNRKYSCQRSSRPDYIILIKSFYGDYSFDKEVGTYVKCYTCHNNSLTEENTGTSNLYKANYRLRFEILDKDSTLIYVGSISHSSRDKVGKTSNKFFSCMGDETKPKYKNKEYRKEKKVNHNAYSGTQFINYAIRKLKNKAKKKIRKYETKLRKASHKSNE